MEKRKRVRIELPVYVSEKNETLRTGDISEDGCFIRTDAPLEEGSTVNLIFYHKNRPICVKGVVRHVSREERPGMGIKFTDVPREFLSFFRSLERKKSSWNLFKKADTFANIVKNLLLFFFMGTFLLGVAAEKIKTFRTEKAISKLEEKTNQKIITMIHREVRVGLFGIPIKQYIEVKDAEHILKEIRETPPDKPIGLVIHTPGGILFSAFQIAKALKEHRGKVTVYVPHYAMSGGTLIALAADEIVMDRNAILGPVDPQMMSKDKVVPAVSILNISRYKKLSELSDETLIAYDQARKAVNQVKHMVSYLLSCKEGEPRCERIFSALVKGTVTHDYPVTFERAKELGLPVRDDVPKEVYSLLFSE